MPGAAAAAVVGWLGVTGAAATFVTAVVYTVVTVAINYGLTQVAQSLAGKPKQYTQGPRSRDITVRGTVEPAQLVYGEAKSGGFIAFYGTSGTNNKYLHFVVVYAFHQCEDITDLWLDGTLIPDADIESTGEVTTTAYQDSGSKLYAWRHLGAKAQTADSVLTSAFSGKWLSTHRGAGVAYVHFRMERSERVYPNGSPASFFALVKGRRLYDPRKDSTNGGSGLHRVDDATTWEWSNNATLCRRDYISGGSKWYDVSTPEKRLAFGESDDRIDDEYTISAANIDDEDVNIPDGEGGETTQKRYTCDVQISCGDTHRENLDILNSAAVGTVTYVNGKYRIYSGAYETPSITIGEDDVLGPVSVSTHPNGEDLYNFITGTFFDESRDWQQCPFPNITNSSYEAADRGQKPRKIELHATRTSYRAQRIGILHLTQSRNKITVRFERLSPKAMSISEHETFYVTLPEFGWDEKVFRCREWEWMPDGFVALTAQEDSSARYADPEVETYAEPEEATVETPQYDEPDTPLNLAAISMPEGILFTWDVTAPFNSNTLFRLYEYSASTPFSSATEVWSGKGRSTMLQRSGYGSNYYWLTAELNGIESEETPSGSGLEAAPGLRGFEETFHDSFEHQDYERFYNLRSATTPIISYPTNGENGGRVIRVAHYGWLAWKKNIPYDPDQTYMLTVRARLWKAPTDSGKDLFYAGVEGVAADGTTLVNVLGANSASSQHYIAAFGFDFGSVPLREWTTFRGYMSGHGASPSPLPAPTSSAPAEAYSDGTNIVRFVRPMFICNLADGDGIMEVDYIKLDRVVYTNQIGPNAATQVYSATKSSTDVYTSGSTPTLVTSVSVPAEDSDTEMIVTAVGRVDHNLASGFQSSTYALITDFSTSGSIAGSDRVIARNPSTTATRTQQSFSLESRYSVPAGTAKTFRLYGQGASISAPGSQCLLLGVLLKVEVIRR